MARLVLRPLLLLLLLLSCATLPTDATEDPASEHEALYPSDASAVLKLWPRRAAGNGWRYLVQVDVGTPTQELLLLLDTGSHQLLLRDAARGACSGPSEPPAFGACFNSSASGSLELNQRDEVISFSYVVDVDVELNGRYHTATDRAMLGALPGLPSASASAPTAWERERIIAWVALLEAVPYRSPSTLHSITPLPC